MVKKILANSYVFFVLLLMYVPIFVLIVFSFTVSANVGDWNGFSLDLYSRLVNNKEIMAAVGNTIIIALISAVCSTIVGTLGAIGTFYSSKKTRAVIENMTQIPVANAEIVIALSLTFMFVFLGSYIFRSQLFGFWTILFGHMVLSVPFVYLNVKPKLVQMDPALYEAALDLGCNSRQALNKVVLPQIFPGVISGFMLAITLSLDDFIVTALTTGPGLLNGASKITTISTYIQSVIKKKNVPIELRALTTLIFVAVVIALILVTLYQKRQSEGKSHFLTRAQAIKRSVLRVSFLALLGLSFIVLLTLIIMSAY
jgi:spermidine/putrescine transport system permease protein